MYHPALRWEAYEAVSLGFTWVKYLVVGGSKGVALWSNDIMRYKLA